MSNKNIGKLLDLFDLGHDFSDEQLKSAYKDLVQVWHPDKYENNDRLKERAEAKIKEINEAYGTLRTLLDARNEAVVNGSGKAKGRPSLLGSVFYPTDFSPESDAAFAHALKIALVANARLNLFHVSPDKDRNVLPEFPKIRDTLIKWNVISAENPEEDIQKMGFYYSKVIGVHSDPVSSILNYLKSYPSDITVIATHGRSGVERLMRKSVAEKVSRESGGMTLFLKKANDGFVSMADGSINLKNILVPVDVEPDPHLAINAAMKFAGLLGNGSCVFTLLYVGDPARFPEIKHPDKASWEWNHLMLQGNAVETILKVASDIPADLIVMGTQGHQGFLDALRGNTTEQILRTSPCPVLAVPERRRWAR